MNTLKFLLLLFFATACLAAAEKLIAFRNFAPKAASPR